MMAVMVVVWCGGDVVVVVVMMWRWCGGGGDVVVVVVMMWRWCGGGDVVVVWCDDVHGGGGIDVGGDVVACAPGDQCDGGCTLTRNTRSVRKLLYFDQTLNLEN